MPISQDFTSPLLEKVRAATTIEAGLTEFRTGIADQLTAALGSNITQMAQHLESTGGGGGIQEPNTGDGIQEPNTGGVGGIPAGLDLVALNRLYMGLVTEDVAWAEALTANTPQATADQEEGTVVSRSAYA